MTFVGYGGISVRRQGVQGLHVHVGMPSAEECWRCLEAILPWLPVVLALSANSPWFAGELTGMASNRAPVLAELPRARRAARVCVVRRMGGVGRAARRASASSRTTRASGGTFARIRSSGRSRCASPTSRPTCAVGRVHRACRRSARRARRACPRRRARRPRPRRLPAEPLGGGALRPARRPAASGRRATYADRCRARRPSCSSSCGRRRARSAARAARPARPGRCEADLQLERRAPQEAAADVVAPLASLRPWQPSRRRSRSAASAARSA